MITILIADDHVLFRESLALLIKKFNGFEVIGEASNGEEVLVHLEKGNIPQLLLLDLNMPKMDGFATAKIIKEKYVQVKIIILTMYNSGFLFLELLQLGVKGILMKNINRSELEKALLAVSNSQQYYSIDDVDKLTSFARQKKEGMQRNIFNATEIEFLRLASTDLTYKEIAAKMDITPRKADHLRDSLFEKLLIKNRVGLAMYAAKNGLIFLEN